MTCHVLPHAGSPVIAAVLDISLKQAGQAWLQGTEGIHYLLQIEASPWVPLHPMVPCSIIKLHFKGLAQDCSNSSVLAMELLQSCA